MDKLYLLFEKGLQESKVSIYFSCKTTETKCSTRNYLHFAIKVYACLALDWQARKTRSFFPLTYFIDATWKNLEAVFLELVLSQ